MRIRSPLAHVLAVITIVYTHHAHAGESDVHRELSDALMCKANPAEALYGLVQRGSDFKSGYAAHGFGDGTSYKAVVILRKPLQLADAKASAVISETENSHVNFAAFTYARFEGDYREVVKTLKLQAAEPYTDTSLGRFVSRQASPSQCPPAVILTPVDEKHFLLGCGWCNGG